MRRNPLLPIAALSTLAMLAACGSKEPAATAEAPEAETVVAEAPPAAEPAPAPVSQPAPAPAASKPASSTSSASTPKPKPAPTPAPKPVVAQVVTVPAGTELTLSLSTPLSSKTAKVGDAVRAQVTSPISVDGKVAIAAGTTVAGSVTKVVSGSDKIGGKPALVVSFDRLELPGGKDVPLAGEITQKGKSDTAGDTAKIVGGAALGAIVGNEVKGGDKGKVIGGLLGAAAGAVAAHETGTEAKLKEGTELGLVLSSPVEITK